MKGIRFYLYITLIILITACDRIPPKYNPFIKTKKRTTHLNAEKDSVLTSLFVQVANSDSCIYYGIFQSDHEFSNIIQNNPIDKEYRNEIKKASSIIELSEIEENYLKIWDHELEIIYNKLRVVINDQYISAFQSAQDEWLKQYNKEINFIQANFLNNPDTTTQHKFKAQFSAKKRSMTRQRVIDLYEYYYMMGYEISFDYH